MKKVNNLMGIALVLLLVLGAGPLCAQASKFAAAWDTDVVSVQAEVSTGEDPACFDGVGDSIEGPCVLAEELLATIDVAQQKDLLIGVSGQIGLHTFTQAKGKNTDPSLGSATASAGVTVTVELRDSYTGELVQTAAPGPVVFASRLQELKVDLADSDTDLYTEVVVSLLLETTAAHHFNFIGVDLDQGDYDVVAVFDLSAWVEIVGEDAIAEAQVTLGPRMVTAQEVRAAKGSLIPLE